MIALVQIALPSDLLILPEEKLDALAFEKETRLEGVGEVRVSVQPPYRSQRPSPVPASTEPETLDPVVPQPVDPAVQVDGVPAIRCDAIAVKIVATDFDRREAVAKDTVFALLGLACEAVNRVFERFRVLTFAPHLKPFEPDPTSIIFRLIFLDDSSKPLAPEEGKFRHAYNDNGRLEYVAVTSAVWGESRDLDAYELPPWDQLLLDAMDLDAELGPSLVLAATAVETRIESALNILAEGKVSDALWTWVRDRGDDYTLTPSVSDQLDVLLEAFGGRSLKEDSRLWAAHLHLRKARNSFVHQGRALLGKRKEPVTREKARELVQQAREIIDFIEALLPEDQRRPRLKRRSEVVTDIALRPPRV